MNKMIVIFLLIFSPILAQNKTINSISLFPQPLKIEWQDGSFLLSNNTVILESVNSKKAINLFKKQLNFAISSCDNQNNYEKNIIKFLEDTELKKYGNESYKLKITTSEILIFANAESGFFYAVQTLLQIISNINSEKYSSIKIPCVEILDYPKYEWRSFLLDSGRQYQTVEFIKRYLNYLSMLKINKFHWHLTEGQGWRIEIKKYPKLTSVGAFVADGKEQKGFYTQDEIKEIISYAENLCIEVVPEIDVPGHSEAALIAYPELSCTKKAPESVMGFSANLFCGGNEATYKFLENVLDEVCELFPSKYIHLGGDEAPKDNWDNCEICKQKILEENLKNSDELQLYFSKRLAEYLKIKNKEVIFWGDIIENEVYELPENTVIYWWNYRKNKDKAFKNALKINRKVICGTNQFTYLNYPVTPWSKYKEDRTFDLRDIFESNPSNIENPDSLVLGMGSSLWTDWNVRMEMIDKRVFPRILALADQMWYGKNNDEDFNKYYEKIKSFYPILENLNISYGPALREETQTDYSWE
ncbi:MAG: beta-N-acetylhexosaminidase [Ignavibacteriales bacterium]|nr:beta-N-acetylhexosaminidase [Ignavibacteriales bacterium]